MQFKSLMRTLVAAVFVFASGLPAAQTPGGTPVNPGAGGSTDTSPRLGSRVEINSVNTATGTSTLKPGFNCPPGKTWNADVAYPACVGTPTFVGRRACNSAPVTWSGASGAQCTANAPVRDDGQTAGLVASGAYTGTATALCSNGYWTTTGASTCTPPPCPASTLQWQVGSSYCQGAVAAATNGITRTTASNNANPGSASFMCNNGTWGAPFTATCVAPSSPPPLAGPGGSGLNPIPITPPAPGACNYAAATGSWAPGCTGSAPAGTLALNATMAVNNTAPGYSGAITYRCEIPGGAGSPSMREISRTCNPGPSCSYAQWGKATGDTVTWSSGGNDCSGPLLPPPAPGTSLALLSNSTNGNTGTYRATCNPDGSIPGPAVVTCDLPPTTQCNPRAVSWPGADGSQCSGFTTLTPYGQTVTVFSDNGSTGATDITCNPGTGTWGAPFNSNCEKPVQPCPGGGTMAWGNCYGPGPLTAMADGEQFTALNAAFGYTGASHNTCKNGIWMQDSATCDVDAAPVSCSSGYTAVVNFGRCTKRPEYAGEIQPCTVGGNCMPASVAPPPGYTGANSYVTRGSVWVSCPTDTTPWFPLPPETQALIDQDNLNTRQTYCTD